MMEAVDKTADTVKSIGYAVFHPKKTAKEVAKTIKATAEEKGVSYVGGYVLGEAAQGAAMAGAGSTVKAAKAGKTIGAKATAKIKKTDIVTADRLNSNNNSVKVNVNAIENGTDTSWYKPDGSINYPPNNGAVIGSEVEVTLKPGYILGRYGNIGERSNFVTQAGADAERLALPPNTKSDIYREFEVIKEIPNTVQAAIAPWGGSAGGGLQYELPKPILQLIKEGYIVPM